MSTTLSEYLNINQIHKITKSESSTINDRRVAKDERGGEDSPPARLKQVQFALNKKLFWCYAFFGAMP